MSLFPETGCIVLSFQPEEKGKYEALWELAW
jgi:hypothetical protein